MTQEPLFHEDWRDSLRHVVKALGGFEAVGADLFPNKTRKSAGNWLSDCINPERPAKLDLEDIEALLRLGREQGVNTATFHLCDSIGYTRPQLAAVKSPKTLLMEKDAALAAQRAEIQREIDRLESAELLKAV